MKPICSTLAMIAIHSRACDLCGCYTPQLEALPQTSAETPFGQPAGMSMQSWSDRLYAAVGEQFTYFGIVQVDGREVKNPSGQFEDSSITQLVAGYSLSSRFALQLNIPLIYRYFERPEGFKIDKGTESGLGDVSLLLKTVLFHDTSAGRREVRCDGDKSPVMVNHEPALTASVFLLTGLKFPPGDSSRIKEEFHEGEIPRCAGEWHSRP